LNSYCARERERERDCPQKRDCVVTATCRTANRKQDFDIAA